VRILIAGASGVLGRATLPHLARHDVVALTRARAKLPLLRDLGAEAVPCNVYDAAALLEAATAARPDVVVNFLTDLSGGTAAANNRIRREGGSNVRNAAAAAGAARLVVESVAFPLEGDSAEALAELERATFEFPGEALILRFGRFWGPDTFHETAPLAPAVHIETAGAVAARLLVDAAPATYVVVD
jgi:nucleoside-diphosphate-sugar epimerase